MESIYFAIALGLGIFNLMLLALVASLRAEINRKDAARAEWWDAYPAALNEIERKASALRALRYSHDELQSAFVETRMLERLDPWESVWQH
jgi:hypothetical protein